MIGSRRLTGIAACHITCVVLVFKHDLVAAQSVVCGPVAGEKKPVSEAERDIASSEEEA